LKKFRHDHKQISYFFDENTRFLKIFAKMWKTMCLFRWQAVDFPYGMWKKEEQFVDNPWISVFFLWKSLLKTYFSWENDDFEANPYFWILPVENSWRTKQIKRRFWFIFCSHFVNVCSFFL